MIRILSSAVSVGASVSDTEVVSEITNLGDIITSKALAKPVGLEFEGTIPDDLTVTKLMFRSKKDSENLYRVYEGDAIKLKTLAKLLAADAAGIPISVKPFNPDHGLELVMTVSNGTTAYSEQVVWKVANSHPENPNAPSHGESIAQFLFRTGRQNFGFDHPTQQVFRP